MSKSHKLLPSSNRLNKYPKINQSLMISDTCRWSRIIVTHHKTLQARITMSSRSNEPKHVPLSDNCRFFHSRSLLPLRSHLPPNHRPRISRWPGNLCIASPIAMLHQIRFHEPGILHGKLLFHYQSRGDCWFMIDRSNAMIVLAESRGSFPLLLGAEMKIASRTLHFARELIERINGSSLVISWRDMTKIDLRFDDAADRAGSRKPKASSRVQIERSLACWKVFRYLAKSGHWVTLLPLRVLHAASRR